MASADGGAAQETTTLAAAPVGLASSSHRRDDDDAVGIPAAARAHVRQQQRQQREHRQDGGGGVIGVPGRIFSTLQRKFWDSNKVRFREEAANCKQSLCALLIILEVFVVCSLKVSSKPLVS